MRAPHRLPPLDHELPHRAEQGGLSPEHAHRVGGAKLAARQPPPVLHHRPDDQPGLLLHHQEHAHLQKVHVRPLLPPRRRQGAGRLRRLWLEQRPRRRRLRSQVLHGADARRHRGLRLHLGPQPPAARLRPCLRGPHHAQARRHDPRGALRALFQRQAAQRGPHVHGRRGLLPPRGLRHRKVPCIRGQLAHQLPRGAIRAAGADGPRARRAAGGEDHELPARHAGVQRGA
mmetsp:Transcript_34039/g.87275  ORF Transcript_34039/g.87275 Transcript_34039/m.87275 type:complete len:230 (-) Transcript_34039:190-879(-)